MAEWKRKRAGWRAIAAPAAVAVGLIGAMGPVAIASADGGKKQRTEFPQRGPGLVGKGMKLAPVVTGPSAPATAGVEGRQAGQAGGGDRVEVIVRGRGFSGDRAVDAAVDEVREAGGTVADEVPLVGGVVAEMPLDEAIRLDALPGVVVVPNERISSAGTVRVSRVLTAFPFSTYANEVWQYDSKTGSSATVAVVDSGVADVADFAGRLTHVNVNPAYGTGDGFGHGTHVAGTIAGRSAFDRYVGIAPDARIIDVKVLDADGQGDLATVLSGLQWVSENAAAHNIRVVNISLGSDTALGYMQHPLNAAVEALWRQGIVVVVAAGNSGEGTDAISRPPANDPYVITVGASDEKATRDVWDDQIAPFSSRGTTVDGFAKPDLYAPGTAIAAPGAPNSFYVRTYPHAVTGQQMRMSGSSMATAVVSGIAALMVDKRPELTPDLVKAYLVRNSTQVNGMRVPDAYYASTDTSAVEPANQGLTPAPSLGTVWGNLESTASWAKASWAKASWAKGAAG